MKIYLFFAATFFAVVSTAQITLDTELDPADLMSNLGFNLVYLDDNEPVYISSKKTAGEVELRLFDMDFNFIQDIVLPLTPGYSASVISVQFISRTLFDCDPDNIEALVNYGYSPIDGPAPRVQIIRDDGTVLFEEENAVAIGSVSYGSNSFFSPVLKTATGTKLFLFKTSTAMGDDGMAIYNVCGDLPQICCDAVPSGIVTHTGSVDFSPRSTVMPNPTNDIVQIEWAQSVSGSQPRIELYGPTGLFLQTYSLDNGQNRATLDLSRFSSGTYIYRIVDQTGQVESGKVVKQ
jgi:hypothetical protein